MSCPVLGLAGTLACSLSLSGLMFIVPLYVCYSSVSCALVVNRPVVVRGARSVPFGPNLFSIDICTSTRWPDYTNAWSGNLDLAFAVTRTATRTASN